MIELLEEILESIRIRKNGVKREGFDYYKQEFVEQYDLPRRGIGTKNYTLRRIQLLEDKLKQLKKDLKSGKYDYKE